MKTLKPLLLLLLTTSGFGQTCPTWPDFFDAVGDWPNTAIFPIVTINSGLPGWELINDSSTYSILESPDETSLGSIAEDESLTFTVRHWGNECVSTSVDITTVSGSVQLESSVPVDTHTFDNTYIYTPGLPGYVLLEGSLDDGVSIRQASFALRVKTLFTLNVSLGTGSNGSPNSSGIYVEDDLVNYSYNADLCYADLSVTLDGSPTTSSGSVLMDSSHTLSISAALALQDVVVTPTSGGTTDKDGTNSVTCMSDLSITATPDSACYVFSGWSGDASGTDNPLALTNITTAVDITANFTLLSNTVTVGASTGGSTDKNGANSVNCGSDLTITATPGFGCFAFAGWSGGASGTDNPLTLTNITTGLNIAANFVLSTNTVTVTPGSGGTTNKDGANSVTCTSELSITATPDSGCYVFTGWSGDASGTDNPLILSNITDDITVVANFEVPFNITVPDGNFLSFLVANFDSNGDGAICSAEAQAVTYMDCSSKNIADLTGVEFFTSMQTLYCQNNQLTSLPDLSALTNLRTLHCQSNQLTSLPDLSALTSLQSLYCYLNQLTSLPELSTLTNLQALYCQANQLTSLPDLSALTNLQYLYCQYNELTSLPDLSALTNLEALFCFINQLTSLPDLSALTSLHTLHCYSNQLTSLPDLSTLTNLQYLLCYSNQLTSLPDLSALIILQTLECSTNLLTGLPDLGALASLQTLSCSSNQLTSLPDLSSLTSLQGLYCSINQLPGLPDLSALTNLQYLSCYANQLTSLPDISALTSLETLACSGNDFDAGDCSDIQAIEALGLTAFQWNPQSDSTNLTCL